MRVVLLRVGIDSASGGIQGPLFKDSSFEFIPIPDEFGDSGVSIQTYSNTLGRCGRHLIEYFPKYLQEKRRDIPIHWDPEFDTFTYGDPTPLKRRLRDLGKGDLLVFYCGLQGWDFPSQPGLYIIGYFEVELAGLAIEFTEDELKKFFAKNFHVRHYQVFQNQKSELVLVKGGTRSRLLRKAKLISSPGKDRRGKPLKVLSPEMQAIFGDFQGKISIQRSAPRWVEPEFVDSAARFVRSLP